MEAGVVRMGTPICVPAKEFVFIGVVASIEINNKPLDTAQKGQEVGLTTSKTRNFVGAGSLFLYSLSLCSYSSSSLFNRSVSLSVSLPFRFVPFPFGFHLPFHSFFLSIYLVSIHSIFAFLSPPSPFQVCIKIEAIPGEAPKMVGRHFEPEDQLVSRISRESIDAVKNYFRDEMTKADWQLMIELKKIFDIL